MLNMILIIKRALPLLLLQYLWACSVLASFTGASPEKIESLMQQHRYQAVLSLAAARLEKLPENSDKPAAIEKRAYWQSVSNKANAAATHYQSEKATELKQLLRRNEWDIANREVALLRENLPANPELDTLLLEFDSERQRYVDALSRSLVKLEAKHLPQTLSLYERLFKAEPENSGALTRLQQERDKRDRLIQAMSQYARKAEAQQEYGLALNYLRNIQRFEDSQPVLDQVKRLRSLLANQKKQQADSDKLRELSSAQKQQLVEYGEALNEEQWLRARLLLDDMLEQRPSDGELLGQQTYLNHVFSREVARAKELGESFYSTGSIEKALSIWNAALPMAPDDGQLKGNIERAQRILEKVKILKQSQTY